MKLIYCPHCYDIVKLHRQVTTCECGKSFGAYLDDLHAVYFGDAIPLGIDNPSFVSALENQPASGDGTRFEAFVIPKRCLTFTRMKRIGSTEPYHDPDHLAPDEEVTFGGAIRKTGVKRGPHRGTQPER